MEIERTNDASRASRRAFAVGFATGTARAMPDRIGLGQAVSGAKTSPCHGFRPQATVPGRGCIVPISERI